MAKAPPFTKKPASDKATVCKKCGKKVPAGATKCPSCGMRM